MRWDGLKSGLASGRKSECPCHSRVIMGQRGLIRAPRRPVLRLVKPMEHLQSALNNANTPV
jgi:hypothetical protein